MTFWNLFLLIVDDFEEIKLEKNNQGGKIVHKRRFHRFGENPPQNASGESLNTGGQRPERRRGRRRQTRFEYI